MLGTQFGAYFNRGLKCTRRPGNAGRQSHRESHCGTVMSGPDLPHLNLEDLLVGNNLVGVKRYTDRSTIPECKALPHCSGSV